MDNSKNIANYFKELTGVEFYNIEILKNKITIFCKHQDIKTENLLNILKIDSNIKQQFINYLTTNETYFYREFSQIEKFLESAKNKQNIRILSAPCASGEEPYSIAISLLEIGKTDFEIVGIDINSEVLEIAKNGVYNQRRISKLPENLVKKYFIIQNDKYILSSKVKSFVTFKHFNIFDSNIYSLGKFDYIFSRNMLIYFDKNTKQKAINILENLKKENGEIFFGHADRFV